MGSIVVCLRRRQCLLALASAAAVLALTLVHVGLEISNQRAAHRQQVEQIGFSVHDQIEHVLFEQLYLGRALAAYASAHVDLPEPEFTRFAAALMLGAHDVRSLQLAPDGIVRMVHPRVGNEAALGVDLAAQARRLAHLRPDEPIREAVLLGPLGQRQGGLVLIGLLPMQEPAREGADAPLNRGGFAVVVIDFPALLAQAGLPDHTLDLQVALRGRHGLGPAGEVFYGREDLFRSDAVQVAIRLSRGSWRLALYPVGGWHWSLFGSQAGWSLLVGSALAFSLGALVFQLARHRTVLEDTVRRTTARLHRSESRYRNLFESAPDGIFIVEAASGRCLGANAQACRLTGCEPAALPDLRLQAVLHLAGDEDPPADPADWLDRLLAAPRALEGSLRGVGGAPVPVEVLSAEVGDGPERLVQITMRDISERLAAQAELRKLSTVVERMPNAVMITDPQGVIEYVNPAFTRTAGYEAEQVKGQTPRLLNSGRHPATFYEEMWACIGRGETWQGHIVNRHRSGSLFEEDATIIPVHDEAGRTCHYIAIKTDVTDRVRLEKQLRQAQKMEAIGTLAGGIAHEFNNILTPVMGYSELLTMRLAPDSKEAGYVAVIRNASVRARNLVSQILQFSRLREGERSPIDLRPAVKEAMRLLEVTLPANIQIVLDVASTPMMAVANSTEIHTVLMNLCVNARDAMPDGGTLFVRLHKVHLDESLAGGHMGLPGGDYVRLEVSDTGVGIPDWAMEHIFDPFFSTKGVGKGTGLGLATAYGIVQGHEGAIQVQSQPNAGTRFEVFIPATLAPGPFQAETAREPARGWGSVLLVDDDPFVLEFVREALTTYGYEVETCAQGRSALEKLVQHGPRFHVVVTDLAMPEMGGDRLMAEMQRHQFDLPIVLTTGNENIARELIGIGGPPFLLLPKPFTAFDVVDAVQRAMEQHHQPRRALQT